MPHTCRQEVSRAVVQTITKASYPVVSYAMIACVAARYTLPPPFLLICETTRSRQTNTQKSLFFSHGQSPGCGLWVQRHTTARKAAVQAAGSNIPGHAHTGPEAPQFQRPRSSLLNFRQQKSRAGHTSRSARLRGLLELQPIAGVRNLHPADCSVLINIWP